MRQVIFTKNATNPTGPYSQAVKVGNTVYLAGVCGDDPVTGEIVGTGDIKVETCFAMENLKHTIEAAGGKMDDIVKVQVYVRDIGKLADFNNVYTGYFSNGYLPARIAVEVSQLAGRANLELDAIAVIDN